MHRNHCASADLAAWQYLRADVILDSAGRNAQHVRRTSDVNGELFGVVWSAHARNVRHLRTRSHPRIKVEKAGFFDAGREGLFLPSVKLFHSAHKAIVGRFHAKGRECHNDFLAVLGLVIERQARFGLNPSLGSLVV